MLGANKANCAKPMNITKVNRNDPCPCGSGKKYKQCCQNSEPTSNNAAQNRLLESIPDLFKQAVKAQQENERTIAESIYQKILDINPKHAGSLHQLGIIAHHMGNQETAALYIEKAIRVQPTAIMYYHLGNVFLAQDKYEDAETSFTKAIGLNPSIAEAHSNLGDTHLALGKYDAAANNFRHAISLNPSLAAAHHNLLYSLCFHSNYSPTKYLDEAKRRGQLLTSQAKPYTTWQSTLLTQDKPLRIGFVSGDLRNHPVGYFLESILMHINNQNCQLIAYATHPHEDELTARIKPYFSDWKLIANDNDAIAAQKIHDDGIHILIDLSGYTALNRLPIFAWKPALIQVSWLGYFASTGLPAIDYFLADSVSVPDENHAHFSEQIWYLKDTRLCFTPPPSSLATLIAPLPAQKNGYITFGCFQKLGKITDQMLKVWGVILQRIPQSRLKLKNWQMHCAITRNALLQRLLACGISLEQVEINEGSSRADYFASYNDIDIMLDTFPFPGGTTTCEALWMGVPTLTLAGNTLLERQGMSMLSCIGLHDWIAFDEQEYIDKAVTHAQNTQNLAELRSQLRQQMATSPLTNAAKFAQNLEEALHKMWQLFLNSHK